MNNRRTEYNKQHYDIQRKQSEALRKFREENPEKFAELMKQAQATTTTSATPTSSSYVSQNTLSRSEIQRKIALICKEIIASRAGRKSFYIDIEIEHVGWIETHRYFENHFNVEEARLNHPEAIKVTVTPCTCPLCV